MAAKPILPFALRGLLTMALLGSSLAAQAFPKVEHWVTELGTRVYYVPRHDLPMIDVLVAVDAGESRSPAGKEGMATLVAASILDKELQDNERTPPYQQIANSGNQISMGAGRDRATFSLRVASRTGNALAVIDILSEQLGEANFPNWMLRYRRDWLIPQLPQSAAKANATARLGQELFGNHPYSRSDRRDADSADRPGSFSMRSFHREYYRPGNISLTLVGDLSREEAEKIANQLTRRLPRGEPAAALPEFQPAERTNSTITVERAGSQSQILLGIPLALRSTDPDYAALVLGNYILGGGGQRSRLMRELRLKDGLTYGVYSSLSMLRQGGSITISAKTRNDQREQFVQRLNQVLDDFARNGPTAEEFAESRKHLLLDMAQWGDTNAELLELVGELAYKDLPLDFYDRLKQQIAALDASQVQAAWNRQVRPATQLTVIQGPKD
ncbi:M16 family metallopeptidase [Chitinilyticum piscinae]|uniref:Insulinase family protein n=1 Tax=Chitinilyticum piscinae TaxID=2866724 RepID=A0A8J7FKY8_9NEIS|nr:pitrilysin family protein [Chitinilyticum piscinae]MBE9608086.1 insulinase family protein [Chitinilyticum piscinae]